MQARSVFRVQAVRLLFSLLGGAWLVALSGCASQPVPAAAPAAMPVASSPAFEDERIQRRLDPSEIRPGYLLSIKHPHDSQLQLEARVDADGLLRLPFDRRIQTAGMSVNSLRTELQKTYRDLYQSPQTIAVSILQRKFWIEVRGLVKKPGQKLIDAQTTLEEILAQAELTPDQVDYARIEFGGRTQLIDLKQYSSGGWPQEKTPLWNGGEVIWFVRGEPQFLSGAQEIRLLGEINQPGTFAFQNGKTVLDYLSLAGGPKSTANLERIYLYRSSEVKRGPVALSLLEPSSLELAPGDTLLFSSDRASNFERRVQTGASLAAILSAIGIILIAL